MMGRTLLSREGSRGGELPNKGFGSGQRCPLFLTLTIDTDNALCYGVNIVLSEEKYVS